MERRWRRWLPTYVLVMSLFSLVTAQETERPPVFSTSPANIAVPEGARAALNCSAVGHPQPLYQWLSGFVDQTVVVSDRRRYVAPNGSLVFNPFNSTKDKGIYYCQAKNELGVIKSQGVLVEMARSPTITKGPRNVTVVKGSDASFTCVGDGFPSPSYRWSRAGDNTFGQVGASLKLTAVTPDDVGEYFCEVSNVAGRATAGAFLHVQYAPSASVLPRSQTLPHHETPVLTCNFKGFPFVSVQWLKDGQRLERAHAQISTVIAAKLTGEGRSKLTLKNLHKQDSGLYTCAVVNPLGNYAAESQLLVQFPPEAPLLHSAVIDGTSVNLTWSPSHPSPSPAISSFTVVYRNGDDVPDKTKQVTIPGGDSRATSVSKLRKGKSYYFQVAASNTIGKSAPSNVIQADIAATVPDAAPVVLSARSLSSQSIHLVWRQPANSDGGSVISVFVIEHKTIKGLKWRNQTVASNINDTTVRDLVGNTSYVFRVFAVNAVGQSPPSTTIVTKTNVLGSPSIVSDVVVSNVFENSVQLMWRMPDTTREENHQIERFLVRLSTDENVHGPVNELQAPFVMEGGRVTMQLTNLLRNTLYHVTVSAVNKQGEGSQSATVTFTTKDRLIQIDNTSVVNMEDSVQTNLVKDNIAYVTGGIAGVVLFAAGFVIVVVWRCRHVARNDANSSTSSLTTKSDLESPTASLPSHSPARYHSTTVNSKHKSSGDPSLLVVRAAFENALAPASQPGLTARTASDDAFRSLGNDTLGEEHVPSNIGSRVSSMRDDLHLGLHRMSDSGQSMSPSEEIISESSVELVKKKTVTFGSPDVVSLSHPGASSPAKCGPNNQSYSKRGIQLHKVDTDDDDSYV